MFKTTNQHPMWVKGVSFSKKSSHQHIPRLPMASSCPGLSPLVCCGLGGTQIVIFLDFRLAPFYNSDVH